MKIFLIGFMGSGKSTIGPIISKKMNIPFIDADQFLESKYEDTISNIFKNEGEDYFRKLETNCLKEIILQNNFILATGGGVVERGENRELMKKAGTIIFLNAEADTILEMTSNNKERPLLNVPDPLSFISAKLKTRNPLYKEIASYSIDSHLSKPDEVANEIINYLKSIK